MKTEIVVGGDPYIIEQKDKRKGFTIIMNDNATGDIVGYVEAHLSKSQLKELIKEAKSALNGELRSEK